MRLSDMAIMRIDEPKEIAQYTQNSSVYINRIQWYEEDLSWLFMYMDYPMIEVKCKGFSVEL